MTRLPVCERSVGCTRRAFLNAAVATVVATGCTNALGPGAFGDVSAGNAGSLNVGDLKALANVPACVGRDARGVYAMTLVCTHQGCDMSVDGTVSSSGIYCGCHGSMFDVDGAVIRGPANAPLEHFAVSTDVQGNLTVHGGTVVDAATRLVVS